MSLAAVILPWIYLVVSAVALVVSILAYSVRGISGQRDNEYRKYFRLGKIFVLIAGVLILLVGIVAFVGYGMTPRITVNSQVVVFGVAFSALAIIALIANILRSSK